MNVMQFERIPELPKHGGQGAWGGGGNFVRKFTTLDKSATFWRFFRNVYCLVGQQFYTCQCICKCRAHPVRHYVPWALEAVSVEGPTENVTIFVFAGLFKQATFLVHFWGADTTTNRSLLYYFSKNEHKNMFKQVHEFGSHIEPNPKMNCAEEAHDPCDFFQQYSWNQYISKHWPKSPKTKPGAPRLWKPTFR